MEKKYEIVKNTWAIHVGLNTNSQVPMYKVHAVKILAKINVPGELIPDYVARVDGNDITSDDCKYSFVCFHEGEHPNVDDAAKYVSKFREICVALYEAAQT